MPNRFTEIPEGSPPPLPAAVRPLVPIADIFMVLMISRPATGSLSRTWVTPATYWMSAATAVAGALVGGLEISRGIGESGRGSLLAGFVLVVFALGGAAVAVIGGIQRRVVRKRSGA